MNDGITPVEKSDGVWLKRNDLYEIGGCNGGKAASALKLLLDAKAKGFKKVVTSGSRFSPQCLIVSRLCEMLEMNCYLVMPSGNETEITKKIGEGDRSHVLTPYKAGGYQNVLNAYARRFAVSESCFLVPFGMQCRTNVKLIARQCANIPKDVKRIVVPVGSGMTFCGILQGLLDFDRADVEVVGVQTGGNPDKVLRGFIPKFRKLPKHCIKTFMPNASPSVRYSKRVMDAKIGSVKLDEIYEGKCLGFLEDGDLFWIVGIHDV